MFNDKCDYHIIANSSFSWWGAWLGDSEKVVAPSNWFADSCAGKSVKDMEFSDWTYELFTRRRLSKNNKNDAVFCGDFLIFAEKKYLLIKEKKNQLKMYIGL